MKKVLLSCVVLFLLNILHINQLQAQDWQNSHSVTLHTQFPADTYAQKVKVYNNDYLVGITKKEGSIYGFVQWYNGDIFIHYGLLNNTNIVLNDFTFLGDYLYFCGQKLTNQGNYVGIIGYFNMNDFINNGNFNYRYTEVPTINNLTKILINTYNTGDKIVTAIGNGPNTILGTYGQIVHINLADPNTICYNPFPFFNVTQLEVLFDMFPYGDYVITLSKNHPSDQYFIRYFKFNGQYLQNVISYIYTFPNIATIFSSNPEYYPLHIANISQDTFAVCLSASDGQRDFTMINFHKKFSHNIFSSQLLRHYDKDHTVLEMEYSPTIKRLLLLNDSYFNGQGKVQTMTYIDPFETNPYVTLMENFNTPSKINHFSLISPNHYAVTGSYSFSQSNNLHLFATKEINHDFLSCLDNSLPTIDTLFIGQGTSVMDIPYYSNTIINANWIVDQTSNYIDNIGVNCID
jgi:hypothetical protein